MKKLLLVALSVVSFSAFARPEYVVQPGELVEADALCVPVEKCSRSCCERRDCCERRSCCERRCEDRCCNGCGLFGFFRNNGCCCR